MKRTGICISILCLLMAPSVFAQSEKSNFEKIEKTLGTYSNSVGCAFEMDRKNIVEMDIEGNGNKAFVALFINDADCGGGSGSWTSKLAVLDRHHESPDKGGIYVLPEMTMPVASGIGLPRFIDRIYSKDGELWFAGRVHAEKDGNNFPTIQVQAQIQLLKSEVKLDEKNKRTIYYWKSSKDYQGK